ncbi:hypothetical protein AWC38_SpisGene11915 [Stylophora pistillata]|uniref:DZIP3-like HEPN domain-containing protein n=1 Tax=Stylophora pistillata TaxID=50429 RepID=A0A2B4S4R3_STYPI|nr:hypothetical protein AWC38_SpisGene11915 [Stylophora pistillata]
MEQLTCILKGMLRGSGAFEEKDHNWRSPPNVKMTKIHAMASFDGAEEALRSTSARANFHRLTRLLMRGGVQLLRDTFDTIHSPADLPVKLAYPDTQAQLRGARLTQPERLCLYPSTGVYGKSSDFDITLIFKLFRTICNLTPPPGPRGWDDLPNSANHSLVADLRDEWKKAIDGLRRNPLTTEEKICIDELETWYKQDIDIKNELEKLSDTMEDKFQKLRGAMEERFTTLHEDLRSQRPDLVIQISVVYNTQIFPPQAGYHQASGSEPPFLVRNLPEPEQASGAEAGSSNHPEPNNPPDRGVWDVILSFKESVDSFFRYLSRQLHLLVRNDKVGSWHITVECSSLQILEGLWNDYGSGHLNSVVQEMLIAPQVLKKLGKRNIQLKTDMSEEEYWKGKQFFEDLELGKFTAIGAPVISSC